MPLLFFQCFPTSCLLLVPFLCPSLQLPLFNFLKNSLSQHFRPEFSFQFDELYFTQSFEFCGCLIVPHFLFFPPPHYRGGSLASVWSCRCAYFKLGAISSTLIPDKISIVPWCEMEMQRKTQTKLNRNLNLPGYYPSVKYNHWVTNWTHQHILNWLLMSVMKHAADAETWKRSFSSRKKNLIHQPKHGTMTINEHTLTNTLIFSNYPLWKTQL